MANLRMGKERFDLTDDKLTYPSPCPLCPLRFSTLRLLSSLKRSVLRVTDSEQTRTKKSEWDAKETRSGVATCSLE